jgi:hypothetical protein
MPPKVPGRMAVLPQEWSYEGWRLGKRLRCTGKKELMAFSSSMQLMVRLPKRWCRALKTRARALAISDMPVCGPQSVHPPMMRGSGGGGSGARGSACNGLEAELGSAPWAAVGGSGHLQKPLHESASGES